MFMSRPGTRNSTSRRKLSSAAGFTLIEVIVAVAIVAVAFVPLLGVHNRNIVAVATDLDLARATLLARQLIAEMELVEKFPELGVSSGAFENYPGFRWEREVSEVPLPIASADTEITLDDVRRVAARLLDPAGLLVVVVGDPQGLEG